MRCNQCACFACTGRMSRGFCLWCRSHPLGCPAFRRAASLPFALVLWWVRIACRSPCSAGAAARARSGARPADPRGAAPFLFWPCHLLCFPWPAPAFWRGRRCAPRNRRHTSRLACVLTCSSDCGVRPLPRPPSAFRSRLTWCTARAWSRRGRLHRAPGGLASSRRKVPLTRC